MFRPVLGGDLDGHAGFRSNVHHLTVDALGVHVDLDGPPGAHDAFEYGPPEIVTSLGHAALAVDSHGKSADGGAVLQQQTEGIAAIRRVSFRSKSLDMM